MRVVDRVHGHAAHGRANALPALGAGLAELLERVLLVAYLTDRGAAGDGHPAHLARAHTQRRLRPLTCNQLHRSTGTARQLRALADLEFDAMHTRTQRDVRQRQCVARFNGRFAAGANRSTGLHALRRQNVAAFAVGVLHQRQVRAAVRIVLEPLNLTRHAVFVTAEIHPPVAALMPTATMTRGDVPVRVTPAGLGVRLLDQRSVWLAAMKLGALALDAESAARRCRFGFNDGHGGYPSIPA